MSSLFNESGEEIFIKMKNIYEELAGISLKTSNAIHMILKVVSYMLLLLQKQFNTSYENMWLKSCDEDTLDLYGDEKGLTRETAEPSMCKVKFKRISNFENIQAIPKGTRISYNDLYFETAETYNFSIGDETCEAIVQCQTEGSSTNGIEIGSITTLVDNIPYVTSVSNTSVTSGGSDKEEADVFRERIRTFPEKYSVAGTKGAYEYFTLDCDSGIADAYAYNHAASTTGVRFILTDGELPSDEMIEKVYNYLSDDSRRALTDKIYVSAPSVYNYTIDFDYYISSEKETLSEGIINDIDKAVETYRLEIANKLGPAINPDEIIKRILNLGAKRTVMRTPVYINLDKTYVAICTSINANYAGIEED